MIGFFSFHLFYCGGAGFEAKAVVTGFQNMAAMSQAIEESGRHLGVAEDSCPFAKAEIGCDDDAGPLVEFTKQMEEQCPAGRAERQ